MAYGGLRGAVSFSLVEMLDADQIRPRQMFVTTTLIVILFTVFVQGGTIKPLVNLLHIKKDEKNIKHLTDEINETVSFLRKSLKHSLLLDARRSQSKTPKFLCHSVTPCPFQFHSCVVICAPVAVILRVSISSTVSFALLVCCAPCPPRHTDTQRVDNSGDGQRPAFARHTIPFI